MASLPENRIRGAREFYRDQLRLEFPYTRTFAAQTGRVAEDIAGTEAFETVLREGAQGGLECSRRIAEMAFIYLDTTPAVPGPWWRDLCNYERSHFMQSATTVAGPPRNRPSRGVSAVCMNFAWDVPKLLERLKSGQAITDELRRNLSLLFARAPDGKVYVVEVGPPVEKVFRATNGLRTVDQIAAAAAMTVDETIRVLEALAGVGAIVPGKSPEEITEILRQQGKA
ncbi:MAG: hypothetical protein ACE14M_00395 [Terriglobales bacterium]